VAVPVRNDAVAASSSSAEGADFFDADGVVPATKVEKEDDSSDDSSSSDLSDDGGGGRGRDPEAMRIDPSTLANAERNLHDAGVRVSGKDLQALLQLLEVPGNRLAHCLGREQLKVQKKMAKVLAKAQRRQAHLRAKYEKVQSKVLSKNKKSKKSSTAAGAATDASASGGAENANEYDALGEWWVVEQALPTEDVAEDAVAPARGRGGHRLEHLRRKLLWPLFWRQVLLEHGLDLEAGVIRQLCFLLKIRKGKLFGRGLATRKDFHAFCQSSRAPAESYISSIPLGAGGDFHPAGKGKGGWKGKRKGHFVDDPQSPRGWKGKGRGHGWGHRHGGGGVHDEFGFGHGGLDDEYEHHSDLHDFGHPHDKGMGGCKGKDMVMWRHMKGKGHMWWKGKGKGRGHHHHHHHHPDHHHVWMEKGKGPHDMWAHDHHWWMMEKGKGKGMMFHHHDHAWGKGKGRGGGAGGHEDTSSAVEDVCDPRQANGGDSDENGGWRRRGCGMRAWGDESGEGGKCLARFVSHVTVPDGTVVEPGASFLKIWSVRNDGNQSWPTDCELVVVGGGGGKGKGRRHEDDRGAAENADGTSTKLVKGAAFCIPHNGIQPAQEVSVALDFRAPQEPGLYQVFFRLRDAAHGKKFGQRLWFSIMVKPAPTPMDGVNPVRPIGSGLSKCPDNTSF